MIKHYSCICKKLDLSISDAHFNALYFAFRTDMMTDTYLYSIFLVKLEIVIYVFIVFLVNNHILS